jgi:hypothetical protein
VMDGAPPDAWRDFHHHHHHHHNHHPAQPRSLRLIME